MTKTKKNKSILKRILAFLGAGVCALACFLCFSSNSISVYADDKFQTFTYTSNVENIKVTNYTSFSKNLLDSSKLKMGVYMFATGIFSTGENYVTFEPISVHPNSIITISCKNFEFGPYSGFLFFNNGVYISNRSGSNIQTVTVPANANQVTYNFHKIGVSLNDIVCAQLEYGASATDYSPYEYYEKQNEIFSLKTTFGFLPSGELVDKFNTFVQFDMYSDYYDYKFSSDNKMTMNMSDMVHYDTLFDFCSYYYDSTGVLRKYSDKKFFINFFNLDNDSGQLFNGDVIKIVKGSYLNYKTYYSDDIVQYYNSLNNFISKVNNKFNFISYVAKNGASINIVIPLASDFENDYYPLTTYYLEGGISDSYNDGFSNGQLFGYENGYKKGNSDGYNDGFSKGKNVGFENGYSKGISESNDYTFLGLISACIDAPITYFTSLFNFELLGVNLSAFLTGLFTLCVIVTIVKLCLGGK